MDSQNLMERPVANVGHLVAAYDKIVEAQMPSMQDLPEGSSATAWLRQQEIITGCVDPGTRKAIGFKADGMPAVVELAKKLRTEKPAYARGTSLRSFINKLAMELIKMKEHRLDGPIQAQELADLKHTIETWLSVVSIKEQHLIPCAILPQAAATFSIGSVEFLHASSFDPGRFGAASETMDVIFGPLFRSMQERAASWLAIVPVDGCEAERSGELAGLAVDIALAALQLVIPPEYGARAARITGRTLPPYTASVVVSSRGIGPRIVNSEPGRGMSSHDFDALVKKEAAILSSAGSRVSNFLSGDSQLPNLDRAWSDAAFWFHEALAEPLESVSIAKLETSIENLFGAGNPKLSTARVLQAIKGVFGLEGSDPIAPGSNVLVKDLVDDIVTSRSRILHGTWSTLGDELPLGREDVANLAHRMLISYTLMLDLYAQTSSPNDEAKSFLNWMGTQR